MAPGGGPMPNAVKLKSAIVRQSIRLSKPIWDAVDEVRGRRAGNVSRNTWVAEAILEKLGREQGMESTTTPAKE